MDADYFNKKKDKAKVLFTAQKAIRNPYFGTEIILNADGFHHLQFSARKERTKKEQLFRFSLLPLGLELIKKSGTIQEYRKLLTPIGKPSSRDGLPFDPYWNDYHCILNVPKEHKE